MEKGKKSLGTKAITRPGTWVQTERKAHEAWGDLALKSPRAAALLHRLVAHMGHQNAVVINQKTLAEIMGCTVRTVQRAVADLVADKWIQAVNLGGAGTINVYVVNDRVAWGEKRSMQPHVSVFSAAVVARADEQDAITLDGPDLRRIPMLYPGEQQLPTGPGKEPPSQPSIPGMEPDLPHIDMETGEVLSDEMQHRMALEKHGQQRIPE